MRETRGIDAREPVGQRKDEQTETEEWTLRREMQVELGREPTVEELEERLRELAGDDV